jgi:hypothetical protein
MDFMTTQGFLTKNNSVRNQRMFFAALSGFFTGTLVTLATSFINTWFFPDLPLYINWSSILVAWVLWAFLGGLLASLSAFSAESWAGVFLSALSMAVTVLVINSIQSSENMMVSLVAFFGLLLPFIAMMFPLAALFYWLAKRFVEALSLRGWPRSRVFLVNGLIILVLGVLPGWYVKMDQRAEQGVRVVHDVLQGGAGKINEKLTKTSGFAEHQDQPYTLSQVDSSYSTVGVDVTVHYDDGYTIMCTVVLYPGQEPSVSPCQGQMP